MNSVNLSKQVRPIKKEPLQSFGDGFSDLVDVLLRRKEQTPDFPKLTEQETHKVFVYGSFMKGLFNHHHLRDANFLGDGSTVRNDYDMVSFVTFPGILKCGPCKGCYILGEIYEVSLEDLLVCDSLESNNSFYKRELTKVKDTTTGVTHTAWMYILITRKKEDYRTLPAVQEWDKMQSWWGDPGSCL